MPKTIRGVLEEFKEGKLHSGSKTGKRVTNRKQAKAIALSEQRQGGEAAEERRNMRARAGETRKHGRA